MAKTYIDAVKYMVKIKFEISGLVDKPDIVGAIFGQSEGLIGEDMDLKELQNSGKLGRIEINHKSALGKTKGEVLIPSSMDQVETSILAAAIETVDKVGPYEANFDVLGIEDVRTAKRQVVADRAKEILQTMMKDKMPDVGEMGEEVREGVRKAKIVSYGKEKLPAGPGIDSSDELIVVEGRADVINLLRASITNVVGMEGAKIPKGVVDLGKTKDLTIFVDGDRGGELIARKLMQIATVKFVAHAPDGKEVEELQRKEIVMALRKKVPAAEAFRKNFDSPSDGRGSFGKRDSYSDRGDRGGARRDSRGSFGGRDDRGSFGRRDDRQSGSRSFGARRDDRGGSSFGRRDDSRGSFGGRDDRGSFGRRDDRQSSRPDGGRSFGRAPSSRAPGDSFEKRPAEAMPTNEETEKFAPLMEKAKKAGKALIVDSKMKKLKEVGIRELVEALGKAKSPYAVIFDGVVTKRLAEAAQAKNLDYIVGVRKSAIEGIEKPKILVIKG